MERRKKLLTVYIQVPNLRFFFEQRNSVVNDKIANKAESIASFGEGGERAWNVWIGIRTDPEFSFIQRHFYYLSGGPFTSLPYGKWFSG